MTAMISVVGLVGCSHSYVEIPIVKSAVISTRWIELRPNRPLKWTEPEEELSFQIEDPHTIGEGLEIVDINGQHFVPEVELIDTDGHTISMDDHGFLNEEIYFRTDLKAIHQASIATVRIRSERPLRISNVIWRGYDPQKVKR